MASNVLIIISLAITVLCGSVFCEQNAANRLEKYVSEFIIDWRNKYPVLKLENVETDYSGGGIKVHFETGEMEVTGIDQFNAKSITTGGNHHVAVEGSVSRIYVKSEKYQLKGKVFKIIPLRAAGSLRAEIEDIWVRVGVDIHCNQTNIKKQNMTVDFTVGTVNVTLNHSPRILSKAVNNQIPKIIKEYHQYIGSIAKGYIQLYFDEYLKMFSLAEYLGNNTMFCTNN